MTTKTATFDFMRGREYRDRVEQRIREVREELGGKAHEPGHVWQDLRDAWSRLARYHRELFGPPVVIQGGKASFLMLPGNGPLIA